MYPFAYAHMANLLREGTIEREQEELKILLFPSTLSQRAYVHNIKIEQAEKRPNYQFPVQLIRS